ncbi:MAG: FkbM family methyltransferase, partial [Thermoanaerobaculia bacterium]|nr:FkbM family methyltransferase [Thermoanaerobaculia bacterium]
MPREDLIFDVGMFDGADTAHYLSQGYRVVGVEANGELVAALRRRFADAIASGRLELVEAAISDRCGTGVLSFDAARPEMGALVGDVEGDGRGRQGRCTREVRCITAERLLADHGVPHYMKVDIEGCDHLCVDALSRDELPRYVSVELDAPRDDTGAQLVGVDLLERMSAKGFSRFKIVDCATLRVLNVGWSGALLLDKVVRLAQGTRWLRRRNALRERLAVLTYRSRVSRRHGYRFPYSATGPWGP